MLTGLQGTIEKATGSMNTEICEKGMMNGLKKGVRKFKSLKKYKGFVNFHI